MEYIYSALLLHKAGEDINESSVKKVLKSAGVDVEESRVKALVAALDGVDIEEAIEKSPSGVPQQASSETSDGAEKKDKQKEDKEEKKQKEEGEDEKSEEEAAEGLGNLF